jgi:arabinogalactan oligomer/maltooligosaccharide transport system substrate-binding protein
VPDDPSGSATSAAAAQTLSTKDPARDAEADLVIWADGDRAAALQKYADDFGKENDITVKVQITTDTRQQFKDATKVNKGPDVVVGAHDWLGELVQNGVVSPVQLAADDAAKFAPSAMKATRFNNQNYGVPYAVENLGLLRNTDLAPEAPKTMDELVAKGQELVAAKKAKQVLVQFVSKDGNAYYSYPYFSAFPGGGIFGVKANGDYDPKQVIVNSPGSVKGGEILAKLGAAKVLSTNVDDTNMDQIFDSGSAPFMITGPWSIEKAKKAGIKYAISPLPSLAGGGPMKPFLGVQMFYVSSKAKNAAMAQEFVTKWVPRKDVQMALFNAGHRPPALTEAYEEASKADPDVKAWFEAGEGGLPMPNIPAMNAVWKPFGAANADIISGKGKAKARLDAAQAEIVKAIAKG